MRSGWCSSARAIACSPFSASATTSTPGWAESSEPSSRRRSALVDDEHAHRAPPAAWPLPLRRAGHARTSAAATRCLPLSTRRAAGGVSRRSRRRSRRARTTRFRPAPAPGRGPRTGRDRCPAGGSPAPVRTPRTVRGGRPRVRPGRRRGPRSARRSFLSGGHRHRRRTVLRRVAEQVEQHLLQPDRVGPHPQPGGAVDEHGRRRGSAANRCSSGGELERSGLHAHAAPVRVRGREQVAGGPVEQPGLPRERAEQFVPHVLGHGRVGAGQLGDGAGDDHRRVADLVGRPGDRAAQPGAAVDRRRVAAVAPGARYAATAMPSGTRVTASGPPTPWTTTATRPRSSRACRCVAAAAATVRPRRTVGVVAEELPGGRVRLPDAPRCAGRGRLEDHHPERRGVEDVGHRPRAGRRRRGGRCTGQAQQPGDQLAWVRALLQVAVRTGPQHLAQHRGRLEAREHDDGGRGGRAAIAGTPRGRQGAASPGRAGRRRAAWRRRPGFRSRRHRPRPPPRSGRSARGPSAPSSRTSGVSSTRTARSGRRHFIAGPPAHPRCPRGWPAPASSGAGRPGRCGDRVRAAR